MPVRLPVRTVASLTLLLPGSAEHWLSGPGWPRVRSQCAATASNKGVPRMTVTLITGANKGLGYETARQLIKHGHTVYLGARSVERGEAAASALGGKCGQVARS